MRTPHRKERSDDGNAFLPESAARNGAKDDLAELMAEAHQAAVINGEDVDDESYDEPQSEEMGGPFIVSAEDQEFGATRTEPVDETYEQSSLPEAVGPLGVASPEEKVEASEDDTGEGEPAPDAEDEPPSSLDPNPPPSPARKQR